MLYLCLFVPADVPVPYIAKRRTANHPCPVCGKHYVNEGSLRKHLACHPETAQFATSLRMWPCSVCQAVFTHEAGQYSTICSNNNLKLLSEPLYLDHTVLTTYKLGHSDNMGRVQAWFLRCNVKCFTPLVYRRH